MASPDKKQKVDDANSEELSEVEPEGADASLLSSFYEIKESIQRLTKSVGELNIKMQATSDVLKWILNTLSQKSVEKETLYLKNVQSSTELLKNFMVFLEQRVKIPQEASANQEQPKSSQREPPRKEAAPPHSSEDAGFVVKPSLVKKMQEDTSAKDKDKKNR
ncbi:MAG: hypothetical protein WED05_07240 [Candidatus Atabeyarchaeum deiterrae]